jgi:hypothetical protein
MCSDRSGMCAGNKRRATNESVIALQDFGYVHFSAGDLLREEAAKPDSSLAKEINEHIKRMVRSFRWR